MGHTMHSKRSHKDLGIPGVPPGSSKPPLPKASGREATPQPECSEDLGAPSRPTRANSFRLKSSGRLLTSRWTGSTFVADRMKRYSAEWSSSTRKALLRLYNFYFFYASNVFQHMLLPMKIRGQKKNQKWFIHIKAIFIR